MVIYCPCTHVAYLRPGLLVVDAAVTLLARDVTAEAREGKLAVPRDGQTLRRMTKPFNIVSIYKKGHLTHALMKGHVFSGMIRAFVNSKWYHFFPSSKGWIFEAICSIIFPLEELWN